MGRRGGNWAGRLQEGVVLATVMHAGCYPPLAVASLSPFSPRIRSSEIASTSLRITIGEWEAYAGVRRSKPLFLLKTPDLPSSY